MERLATYRLERANSSQEAESSVYWIVWNGEVFSRHSSPSLRLINPQAAGYACPRFPCGGNTSYFDNTRELEIFRGCLLVLIYRAENGKRNSCGWKPGWMASWTIYVVVARPHLLYSGVLGFVFSHVVKQGVAEFRSSKGNKCKVEIDGSTKPKAKVRAPWTDSNRNHFSCRRNRRPCCHRDDGSPKSVGKG